MSTAERTRAAVRDRPFLFRALRAGVLNYRAAARFLGVEDVEAGAAALRRFAGEVPAYDGADLDLRIRIESGVGPAGTDEAPIATVGETRVAGNGGEWSLVIAEGSLGPDGASEALARMADHDLEPIATAIEPDRMLVVVPRQAAHEALRCLEGPA